MNKSILKKLRYDLLIFLTNSVVGRVPSFCFRNLVYRKLMAFKLGYNVRIFMRVTFDAKKGFVCGNNTVLNTGCRIDTRGGVQIGENVSISQDVIILTADHNPRSEKFETRLRPVKIGNNCFIGTASIILPGVEMEDGAILAAGSVLTKTIPRNQIWAGNPAKKISDRNSEIGYQVEYHRFFQ